MPQGQDPFSLSPTAGSPCRVYPRDNGKVVGPVAVPVNQGGVSITVSRVSGSGSVGAYQPQEAADPDGPWFNVGSAVSSAGVTNVTVHGSYVRALQTGDVGTNTVIKVCLRAGNP